MLDVRNVHHMQDGANGNAVAVLNIEDRGENFVADKKIIFIAEDAVRSGEPAVSVKLVMIEVILGDELGILRAAAGHPVAHIENHETIAPVGEIGEAVLYLQVVQITSARHGSDLGVDGDDGGIFGLPAGDFLGMFHVLKIDDAQRAGRIVGNVGVMSVNVGAVDAAGDGRSVFG